MINEKEFIQLYNNWNITTREIRKKLNLEYNQYYKIYNRLKKEGKITPRPFRRHKKDNNLEPKNYSLNHTTNNYQIRKNGIYYGCCKTLKQAQKMVELFNENGWDENSKKEVKQKIKEVGIWTN